jgi:hypothetical protein
MTTAERIALLAPLFSGSRFGFRTADDLEAFLAWELGDAAALDRPATAPGGRALAVAPERIYHVCAANLSVSAETSLLIGLLLGSRLDFKLPSSGLPALEEWIGRLPPVFRDAVTCLEAHDPDRMSAADAVVVFGSDETVATLRAACHPRQRFLAYGHKMSAGIVPPGRAIPEWAAAAAREIAAHGHTGCLAPLLYLCATAGEARTFARALAAELARMKFPEGWDDAAGRFTFLRESAARGHTVLPAGQGVVVSVPEGDSPILPGPGTGAVQVAIDPRGHLLDPFRGQLSSLSIAEHGPLDAWTGWARRWGASRICRMGRIQEPHLAWRHDGRPRLGDLVSWISVEEA